MKLIKYLTTTNSYEESFTITDELISEFRKTIDNPENTELTEDYLLEDFVRDFEDELFEFAWKLYHVEDNKEITEYEETDTVLNGEHGGYGVEKD